jgi:hypothetical protein
LLTSEEVLAGRFPCGSSPDGHGTSPSSSCRDSRACGAIANARVKSPRLHHIAHLFGRRPQHRVQPFEPGLEVSEVVSLEQSHFRSR